jgi:translation initiation factor 2B subunit (eIF-2B alpha/beta/delta family)
MQVLVGAEAVVESGGMINKLGTFQVRLPFSACELCSRAS